MTAAALVCIAIFGLVWLLVRHRDYSPDPPRRRRDLE